MISSALRQETEDGLAGDVTTARAEGETCIVKSRDGCDLETEDDLD